MLFLGQDDYVFDDFIYPINSDYDALKQAIIEFLKQKNYYIDMSYFYQTETDIYVYGTLFDQDEMYVVTFKNGFGDT